MVVPLRFAAEQRWSIACGETAGHRDHGTKKLRSSDVDSRFGQTDVAAPQLHHPGHRIPKARALGYLPQLLRSQSHRPPDLPPIDGCALIDPRTHCRAAHGPSKKCPELAELSRPFLSGAWHSRHFVERPTSPVRWIVLILISPPLADCRIRNVNSVNLFIIT